MPTQSQFPSDSRLLTPGSDVGVMVWKAAQPTDNDVWLTVKDNGVNILFSQGGRLTAAAAFNLDLQAPPGPRTFSDTSAIEFSGPLFEALNVQPDGGVARADRLQRFVWMARSFASEGTLAVAFSAPALEEAEQHATVERQAHWMVERIDSLALAFFEDPSVIHRASKTKAISAGSQP